jgi:phosphoserine phosphatase
MVNQIKIDMKIIRLFITYAAIASIGLSCSPSTHQKNITAGDPLNQWNEGPTKASILKFVETVTDKTNPKFLPEEDRVAVFDMDGTILLEKPNFVLFDFIDRIILEQIASKPEIIKKQPYKAFYEKDWAYFGTLDLNGLYNILLDASEGYTEDHYREAVRKYFNTVIDDRYHKPYDQLVYAPVVQLIRYLQGHQFEVYIVSGSDPEFTRVFCEKAADIPAQNVIGSTVLTKWVETDTGSYFIRVHQFVEPINDEGGKPVNILNKVGRVPVLAVGNSSGDYHMLEFSKNARCSLQMIINHDDSVREYNYEAEKMKMLCQENGWQEVSMKNDFKVIFGD